MSTTHGQKRHIVAPYKGAWIEINAVRKLEDTSWVAPYKGAWIEIGRQQLRQYGFICRSLQGSVD